MFQTDRLLTSGLQMHLGCLDCLSSCYLLLHAMVTGLHPYACRYALIPRVPDARCIQVVGLATPCHLLESVWIACYRCGVQVHLDTVPYLSDVAHGHLMLPRRPPATVTDALAAPLP